MLGSNKKAVAESLFTTICFGKKMTIHLDLTWREKLSMSRHALHWKGCADTRRDKEGDLQGQRVTNGCQENTGVWQGAKKFKVRALCDRGVRGIWAHSGGLKSHRMQKKGVWGRKTERERGDTSLLDFREPTLANHKSWLVGNILIYPRTHTHVFDVNFEDACKSTVLHLDEISGWSKGATESLKHDAGSCQKKLQRAVQWGRNVLLQAGISSRWWRVTHWLPFFITTWCLIRPNLSHYGSARVAPAIGDFGNRALYQPVLHYCRERRAPWDLKSTNKAKPRMKSGVVFIPAARVEPFACLDEFMRIKEIQKTYN